MKILDRLKILFNRGIEEYFRTSRVSYVPIVKGGMWVDHETALCLSAVFAAVRYVSESVASLPWELRQKRNDGGSDHALTNNVYRLLHNRPNPQMSSFEWRMLMTSWANLWGNGYAEIERDSMRRPFALWPISPDRVTPKIDANNNLYYEIMQSRGENTYLWPEDMFHIKGLGSDGVQGHSVVSLASRSIGAGLAADEFQASFYENSAVTSGTLTHPKSLGDKAYERLRDEVRKKKQGPKNAWKPWILEEGMKWESMTMPMKDAQFLESRKFTVTEIARWFRVPPHKIGDLEKATFSNIEHLSIEVVQDCIIPWAIRFEQEADYKLIGHRAQGTFYSKINVNGLLRGDSSARSTYYREMRNMGALNADEIRALEDMNPIPGGDGKKYVMQGQYTTLEKIGEEPEPPPQIPATNEPDLDEENEENVTSIQEAFKPIFRNAIDRINNRKQTILKDANEEWSDKSEKNHQFYIRNLLDPIINGYFNSLGLEPNMKDGFIMNFIGDIK